MNEDLPLLLYPKDVQKLLGLGNTKFFEINKLPDFPKQIYFNCRPDGTEGRGMYKTKEILAWVNGLKSEE